MNEYRYTLTYNETPTVLTIQPANWDNLGIVFERNDIYHSVLRSITLSLKFSIKSGGGGDIIINAYNTDGISAEVELLIEKRNPQTNDYDSYYSGVLDFNPDRFNIDYKNRLVEIGTIDNTKEQRFKTREEVNFNIFSLESADGITIADFSIPYQTINIPPIDIILSYTSTGDMNNELEYYFTAAPPDQYESEFKGFKVSELTVNEIGDRIQVSTDDYSETLYINELEENVTIKMVNFNVNKKITIVADILLPFNYVQGLSFSQFLVYDDSDILRFIYNAGSLLTEEHRDLAYSPQTFIEEQEFNYDNLFEIELQSGWYIIFKNYLAVQGNAMEGTITDEETAIINMTETTIGQSETTCRCIFPHEAFTRLIQLATSETDTSKLFYSTFFGRTDSDFETYSLNGSGAYNAITCGKLIRQFPNAPVNLSIKNLFKTFDSFYSIGMGYDRINERFYIEQIDNFFKGNYEMFNLGEVSNFISKPYKDGYFNEVLSGYSEKGDYEEFQGANEYNIESEHLGLHLIKEKRDFRSPYNADSIGIELTRRHQYSESASEDTKGDENIYILDTDGSDVIINGSSISGFNGVDKYFNIKFSPKNNLIRNGGFIIPACWKKTPGLKFIRSSKNVNIIYTSVGGVNGSELDNITETELYNVTSPLFIPEIYEFDSFINGDIIEILNTDPHGYITFAFDNITYNGYLLNVESSDYKETAKYTLIAKEVTDGDNFIYEDADNYIYEDGQNKVFE